MRWRESETINFVQFYFNHELLWNTKHPAYKMRDKRDAAYNQIINEFREFSGILLDMDEVKSKIKNLRSTYTQEVSKILQTSNSLRPYRPSLKWFSEWHKHFKDLPNSRLKGISFEEYEADTQNKSDSWIAPDINDDDDVQNSDTFLPESDSYVYPVKTEPKDTIKREHPETPHKTRKKKIKRRSLSRDDESTIKHVPGPQETTANEDEFDIYGKYIASQLRKMDLTKALKLQLEIQSLVSDARISDT